MKNIHISPKLVNILEKIDNKSEIARKLLKGKFNKEELINEHIDFISISKEDPSKLTYLTPDKILKSGLRDSNEIWKLNKIPAKPGVAIKKLFKEISDKDVEIFTNLFKSATAKKEFELKIIQGKEMVNYYNARSYNQDISGSLHVSCMRYDHCNDFFDIYTYNPEVCKMLIMLDNRGNLLGRALLWKANERETNSEILVMDRIYCVDDNKNIHYFKEWADQNEYIYKKEQKWQNCMFFESHGNIIFKKIYVKINKINFIKYPYLDTFKFWDEKNSIITNYLLPDNGYIRTLMGNNGSTLGGDVLALDDVQQIYINRENLIHLEYIKGNTHCDNTVWSETMDTSIAKNHAEYNEEINDYLFNEEFNKFNNQTKLNARKEQIRIINENKAKKMVFSRKSRASNSDIYNGLNLDDFYQMLDVIPNP